MPVVRRWSAVLLALTAALLLGVFGGSPARAATHRVLVVGDSITQGSSGDFTYRYRLWESLQKTKGADTIEFVGDRKNLFNNVSGNTAYAVPGFDQDHHALWGRAIRDEKETIGPAIAAMSPKPTAMTVHLGTNDGAWGISDFRGSLDGLRLLVQRARAAAPGLDVALGELYPTHNASQAFKDYVRDFNGNLGALAASLNTTNERVVVAPTSAAFNAGTMTWDGVHPNLYGESFLAAGFATALQSLTRAVPCRPVPGRLVRATWSGRYGPVRDERTWVAGLVLRRDGCARCAAARARSR